MMGTGSYLVLSSCCFSSLSIINDRDKFYHNLIGANSLLQKPRYCDFRKHQFDSIIVAASLEDTVKAEVQVENLRGFRWVEIGHDITKEQRRAISQLPFKMEKRCKALMRQIICFSPKKGTISDLLRAWVRIMKPIRADWLSVLKELKTMDHPFYLQVLFPSYFISRVFFICSMSAQLSVIYTPSSPEYMTYLPNSFRLKMLVKL